jgi:hypothetical protein
VHEAKVWYGRETPHCGWHCQDWKPIAVHANVQRHAVSASQAITSAQQLCLAHVVQAVSPDAGEHPPPELELELELDEAPTAHSDTHGPCAH